jgi:hypothetical protein
MLVLVPVLMMLVVIVTAAAIRSMDVIIVPMSAARMVMLLVLVAMRMPMVVLVNMVVRVAVLPMTVILAMRVLMRMVVVTMVVVMMPVVVAAIVLVGAALRLEGAHHHGGRAALAPNHLGEHMIVLDIDRIRRHLGGGVPVAHMIGHLEEAQGVLGPDFQEPLGGGLDLNEATVLELHGIPVVEHGGLVEIEKEVEASIALQGDAAAVPALMIEGNGVGDAIGLHGGSANDGCGAEHDFPQNRK